MATISEDYSVVEARHEALMWTLYPVEGREQYYLCGLANYFLTGQRTSGLIVPSSFSQIAEILVSKNLVEKVTPHQAHSIFQCQMMLYGQNDANARLAELVDCIIADDCYFEKHLSELR